jgi:hypothetical protein
MTDNENRRAEAIGICESIIMRLKDRPADAMFPEEWAHLCRQLVEIEDRVYGHGEYAKANAVSTRATR